MKKLVSIMCAILMVVFATVPAFAAENDVVSPVATTAPDSLKYNVVVIPTEGGDGSYEFTTEIDENGEQGVKIIPKPNTGYTFDHWVIDGPYTTDNKLTDGEMNLVITGDITVTPYYTKDGVVQQGTVSKDNSQTSPKTGANDVLPYAVIMLSVLACGGAVAMLVKTNKKSR
ncbi:MAG: hypothetical protein U0L76_00740 [Ruminococcus sp.]|nr:hypothetical protein [Ruminococcus sp.]